MSKGASPLFHMTIIYPFPLKLGVDNGSILCYNPSVAIGERSEWFKEPVLKTGDAARHRGFESLSLRQSIKYLIYGEVPKRSKGLPC